MHRIIYEWVVQDPFFLWFCLHHSLVLTSKKAYNFSRDFILFHLSGLHKLTELMMQGKSVNTFSIPKSVSGVNIEVTVYWFGRFDLWKFTIELIECELAQSCTGFYSFTDNNPSSTFILTSAHHRYSLVSDSAQILGFSIVWRIHFRFLNEKSIPRSGIESSAFLLPNRRYYP